MARGGVGVRIVDIDPAQHARLDPAAPALRRRPARARRTARCAPCRECDCRPGWSGSGWCRASRCRSRRRRGSARRARSPRPARAGSRASGRVHAASSPRRRVAPAFWKVERPPTLVCVTISSCVRVSNSATSNAPQAPSARLDAGLDAVAARGLQVEVQPGRAARSVGQLVQGRRLEAAARPWRRDARASLAANISPTTGSVAL